MIERLAGRGAPVLQLAADGAWERALVEPLPASAAAVDRLVDGLLAGAPPELAAEVLWPDPPTVFVGARVRAADAGALRARLQGLRDAVGLTPAGALGSLAGGALGPPCRAELGAVNAWRAVGPLALALSAGTCEIESALAGRPDLARCRWPVALEVALGAAGEAWWAVEVSRRSPDGHAVSVERVAAALSAGRAT